MAEFRFAMQQNGNQFSPAIFERLVGIDVDNVDGDTEFSCNRRQRFLKIVA